MSTGDWEQGVWLCGPRTGTGVKGQRLEAKGQRWGRLWIKPAQALLYQPQRRAADVDGAGQLTGLKQSPAHTSYWLPVTSWFYPHVSPPLFRVGGEFSSSSSSSPSLYSTRPFLSPSLHHTHKHSASCAPFRDLSSLHGHSCSGGGKREGRKEQENKRRTKL